MRERIRNILSEVLILESPLFKAVAIRYRGKVYEGDPWMYHANLVHDVLGDDMYDEYENGYIEGLEDGYVTFDGRFVTRQEASELLGRYESGDLRKMKELGELNNIETS